LPGVSLSFLFSFRSSDAMLVCGGGPAAGEANK
jgi:hypothetical protein